MNTDYCSRCRRPMARIFESVAPCACKHRTFTDRQNDAPQSPATGLFVFPRPFGLNQPSQE